MNKFKYGKPETFLPLASLEDLEHPHFSFRLPLPPYCPAEAIGMNIGRLDRIRRLSEVSNLSIRTMSGDTSKTELESAYVAKDGTLAGSGKMRKNYADGYQVRTSIPEETYVDGDYGPRKSSNDSFQSRDSILKLNISEIEEMILESKKPNLHNPEIWASKLNEQLNLGMREVVKDIYFRHPNPGKVFGFSLGLCITTLLSGVVSSDEFAGTQSEAIAFPPLIYGFSKLLEYISAIDARISLKEVPVSFMPFWHIDRAVGALALTKLPTIKPLRF